MPRPKQHRRLISVWVAEAGIAELDRIAAEQGVTRSDVLRLALKRGLADAKRELRKATR